ncbi:MAG TPA: glycosyltransferase family 4 protein [Bacteroidales bacterium]|nr:glycosyltransferase family 4 protein [Bacteroidales bacterium]
MPDKHVHIIAFDIPVPVNYGGAIDIFYKLKSLKKAGVKIHLHCFEYDRKPSALLNELCTEVRYYKRDNSKTKLLSSLPYIVATRYSEELLKNLLHDNYPILFEGLHSCNFLNNKKLKNRKKIVRTHNIEHVYYENLARVEKNMFKRYYYQNEASKLARFEKILEHADGIAAISKNDAGYFSKKFKNVKTVSAFHPNESITSKPGKGAFALYHGSLEVGENNEAALFLVREVFNDLKIKLIIAGNKPTRELKSAVAGKKNITLKTGLDSEDIYKLVSEAHVNILPTFQSTGIKLKLLAALFRGRYCLVNTPMIEKTGLESLCICRETASEFKSELKSLFAKDYVLAENARREEILLHNGFSNDHNAVALIHLLFH